MAVGTAALTVTLSHRYNFESGDDDTRYGGGVIQTSIDGGTTWTDIDATAADYSTSTLSNCSDDLLASRRAYVARSAGYPSFGPQVLNLGSAYANLANFRLRFGNATDAAVRAGGWDIDSISIAGSTDTPFNTVIPQSAARSVSSNKALQGAMSGTCSSASRCGEGVLIDFGQVSGTPIEFLTWYTYGAGTRQWLLGSFGNAFRPQYVVRTTWGRVTHRFIDCNTLELNYQKSGGERGTQVLTRALGRLGDGVCH